MFLNCLVVYVFYFKMCTIILIYDHPVFQLYIHLLGPNPEMRFVFIYSAILLLGNGELPKFEETMKLPLLAKTLRRVAYSPLMADELYNGGLTEAFISDIKSAGGIITAQDLSDYR